MQNISAGDVYFLTSPFHSTVSAIHEKKLAYLLGTVSARPAIVIRPPEFWDEYSTVDVIPSLSNGKPSITISLIDRYGYCTAADYNFMPHTVHSIPVGRLGRFIGRLTTEEYDKIMYAFHWIHDHRLMDDPEKYPIPECYREVMNTQIPPTSVFRAKDCRLSVDHNMTIHTDSPQAADLNGVALNINFSRCITPTVASKLEDDPDYHPTTYVDDTKHSDTTEKEEQPPVTAVVQPQEPKKTVPSEKPVTTVARYPSKRTNDTLNTFANKGTAFPPSIFDTQTLMRVAKDYTLHEKYYPGPTQLEVRTPDILTQDEINTIRGDVGANTMTGLIDFYRTFTAFDAWCLGPYLPTATLARIANLTIRETAALKRLCTFFKNMSEREYRDRKEALQLKSTESHPAQPAEQRLTKMQIAELIQKLGPYLNEDKLDKIPLKLQEDFLRVPQYAVKRVYSGKGFSAAYARAVTMYKTNEQKVSCAT